MPITQDRMKLLIDAAQGIATAYFTQCATLGALLAEYRAERLPLPQLLEYVEMRNVRPDAAIASELIVLSREETRWQFTHNKNEQEQRRLARKRAIAKGLDPDTVAPPVTTRRNQNTRAPEGVHATAAVAPLALIANRELDAMGELGAEFAQIAGEPGAEEELARQREHEAGLARVRADRERREAEEAIALALGKPKDGS